MPPCLDQIHLNTLHEICLTHAQVRFSPTTFAYGTHPCLRGFFLHCAIFTGGKLCERCIFCWWLEEVVKNMASLWRKLQRGLVAAFSVPFPCASMRLSSPVSDTFERHTPLPFRPLTLRPHHADTSPPPHARMPHCALRAALLFPGCCVLSLPLCRTLIDKNQNQNNNTNQSIHHG